jgi:hypothetical protein
MLTSLHLMIDLVAEHHRYKFELHELGEDDPAVYEMQQARYRGHACPRRPSGSGTTTRCLAARGDRTFGQRMLPSTSAIANVRSAPPLRLNALVVVRLPQTSAASRYV